MNFISRAALRVTSPAFDNLIKLSADAHKLKDLHDNLPKEDCLTHITFVL